MLEEFSKTGINRFRRDSKVLVAQGGVWSVLGKSKRCLLSRERKQEKLQ